MSLTIYAQPTEEPITAAEARAWLKQSSDVDDTWITNVLIPAARRVAEREMNRAIISQTWDLELDCQPEIITLPLGLVTAVTYVKTVADDDTETTESSTETYHAETDKAAHNRIFLRLGATWTTTTRARGVMKIRYVVGWDDAASVPEDIKQGLCALVAHYYYNRGSIGSSDIPSVAADLLANWRIYGGENDG